MSVVAVYPAVGHKPHQMQGRALLFCVFHRRNQSRVFDKIAVHYRLGYSCVVLIHCPAGADVGVPDLAVAHLSVGQPHVHSGSAEGGKRVITEIIIKIWGVSGFDCVAAGVGVEAETVHDYQS